MKREAYQVMFANEDKHWWFVARRRILAKIISSFTPVGTGAILEIGCGTGKNLELFTSYGSVFGMEMDDEARMLANKRKICSVRKGALPNAIPFTRNFDLICMFDVLEHIEDDLAALHAVRSKLTSKGLVLLTVPAYDFLWSAHDDELHHKRRYNRQTLITLCRQAGFKVRYATYFNTFFFPLIALIRTGKNLFQSSNGSDMKMPPGMINRILTGIFAAERFLLPAVSLPLGVSLLVVAENTADG